MANRQFFQFRKSIERELVDLYLKAAIGAAGAPTIDSDMSKGIASITRNGAGDYSIALSNTYNKLMMAEAVFENASGIPVAVCMGIKTNSVSSATAPLIRVVFQDKDGAAVDPASGDTMRLHIQLRNC